MTTLRDLVNEVALTLEGYGLNQARSAFLEVSVDENDLSITVGDVANLSEGLAEIGDELIYIQEVDSSTNTLTVSPDGRGYMGSTADDHAAGDRMLMAPVFPRALVRRKINETISGLWPDVWGEGDTSFAWNSVQSTYGLPSEVEDITSMTYNEILPSGEWPPINHYKLDRHADPDMYPSTVSVTLRDARLYAGHTIRVMYRQEPQQLAELDSDLTDSGLHESARPVLVYGACERLIRGVDPSRLAVNTASASEYADTNPVGNAMKIAAQLRAYYELELADEKRRQELRTPPQIVYTENYL